MGKWIDTDAAYTVLTDYYHHTTDTQHAALSEALGRVESVDAVPVVHGRWIIKDNPGTGWYRVTCSECGEDVTSTIPMIGFFPNCKAIWDYCPYCGAKMDEKDGENG